MKYKIYLPKLILQYLPIHKRREKRLNWLTILTGYFNVIHKGFLSHFNALKIQMKWDGRTILLERYLQLWFKLPGLRIVNNDMTQNPLIGWLCPNTKNSVAFAPGDPRSPIAGRPDAAMQQYGFTIHIPAGSRYNPDELKAVVNKYKIGAFNFNILTT